MLSSRSCLKQGTIQLVPTIESSFVKVGMYCYFYRAKWSWLPTISSIASSIPEGRFANLRPSFGKLSPAFLRTKVELMTSASLRNLSNISKATCDNTEFNYTQYAWERTQGILLDRMTCTHSSGEGGPRGWLEIFEGFVQAWFLPRQRRLQIHGCGLQKCLSWQNACLAYTYKCKKDKHNSGWWCSETCFKIMCLSWTRWTHPQTGLCHFKYIYIKNLRHLFSSCFNNNLILIFRWHKGGQWRWWRV